MCVLRTCRIVVSSGDVPCLGMLLPVKFDTCVHVASHVSGGFRNVERGGSVRKFLDCHAHFRSRWKSELNI